jgi:KUP system potassium uptake protein
MSPDTAEPHPQHANGLFPLTLTAIGVVYGDIGTSPLYALRECFYSSHSVPPTRENVMGVLSLIFYALVIVVTIKYVLIVLRADNKGEGGILALTALLPPKSETANGAFTARGVRGALILFGILGAALLYGDGMITPAITVLGAIEGLQVATPVFTPFVVPITIAILAAVFAIQQYGTARIGRLYGPVMVVWFVTLAVLGVRAIARAPGVLDAVHPDHMIAFMAEHGWHAFGVLGAVVLVTTGAESLYADLGHFGRRPIRVAWFVLVLPALLLNYFGQGALMIVEAGVTQPFFQLAPSWALLPLVALSSLAAVIASQALISGVFSLTRAAVQLGYAPRVRIEHTSYTERGQVYVPAVNWFLAVSTITIVIAFRSSGALAAAYGIAVTLTMVCTTLLLQAVAADRWKWPLSGVVAMSGTFLLIDLAFFGSNLLKLMAGGWLPLVIAALLFTLMTTWGTGRRLVASRFTARAVPLKEFVGSVLEAGTPRVSGTAVFMTAQLTGTPAALTHNVRYNKVLHETVLVLAVRTLPVPHVPAKFRVSSESLGRGVYDVWLQYGFMEAPDVPADIELVRAAGVPVDTSDLTYFVGRETLVVTRQPGMAVWREHLFVLMARNAVTPTTFFKLPADRVVELGVHVEI